MQSKSISRTEKMMLFFCRRWLTAITIITAIYAGLAFAAPVLMKLELYEIGSRVYRLYWPLCHQFAHRSWFLFGHELSYQVSQFHYLTGIDPYATTGLWQSKHWLGKDELGWKVALCQRDVAIYGGILATGTIYRVLCSQGVTITSAPWLIYLIIGLFPIGLDGFSQLLSQPPYTLSFLNFRESTPTLRSLTGFLFGAMNVWLCYPYIDQKLAEVRHALGDMP